MKPNKMYALPIVAILLTLAIISCGVLDPTEPGNLVPKTVDEGNPEHADHAVALNGSIFHVETYGDPANPTIIFLHGGPGNDFRGNLRMKERYNGYSLQDEYYLVFWDQRGCGLSKRHNKDVLTIDGYIEDLDQMIDKYSPGEPVILLGHSWGAMYATEYINTYPEKIMGAVISEAGALTGAIYEDIATEILNFDIFSEWLNDWAWDQQILSPDDHARMDYSGKLQAVEESQSKYHEEHNSNDPQPFWRYGAAAAKYIQEDGQNSKGKFVFDFTTHLDQFTNKVLFMASGRNEAIGEKHQRMQMQLFPNADIAVIPDCGHDYWWTKTAEVVVAIHEYLDEIK